jgi:hypothetical protein
VYWAAADSIDELATMIKADEVDVMAHPDTVTEAQKARHSAECSKKQTDLVWRNGG